MERKSLLVSDLDGTLLGDEEALGRFAEWYKTHRASLRLVYATGRFYDSVAALIESTSLPEPDAVIGGVGTEIHSYPDGEHVEHWPRCLSHWDPEGIQTVLAEFDELEPQPGEFQTEFKLSYYAHDLAEQFLVKLRRNLASAGHDVETIYSSNRDLDMLPPGVSKGSATACLVSRWRLRPRQVLVAGDTGNDLSMFMRGYHGIVVGNAHEELKSLRYANVYHLEHAYADGVLDGLQYWLNETEDAVTGNGPMNGIDRNEDASPGNGVDPGSPRLVSQAC